MRVPRIFERFRRRRATNLTDKDRRIAEGLAFADAEDMIRRLGVQWAYIVACEHAEAERQGAGADPFPPEHWERVRNDIRRVMRSE